MIALRRAEVAMVEHFLSWTRDPRSLRKPSVASTAKSWSCSTSGSAGAVRPLPTMRSSARTLM
eukprot:14577684-Alexandrium_andersonii.AAC.1